MVALDERHHTFLQALMRRGPLPEKESKSMFRELFSSSNDKFYDFLSMVNKELDYLQMEVRGSANQYSGMLYYGVVNKLASEEAKLGTRLSHAQLTFFKAILESILSDTSASGSISSMQALNLRLDSQIEAQTQGEASTSQAVPLKLTLANKEETLATLVSDNWLSRSEEGRVCLGTRSFLELRSLFKNFDVPFCDVCNEAAIKVPRVCPGCRTAWGMLSADDDAAIDSDQDNPRNGVSGDELDDEDEDAGVHVPASQTRARRVKPSQRRSKAKLESSDDDLENGDDHDDEIPPAPSQGRKVIQCRPKMKARR